MEQLLLGVWLVLQQRVGFILRRKSLKEKFLGTFRCQTYWLLATRGAWLVLWCLARTGRYEAGKTDRVSRSARRALPTPGG